MGKLSRAQKLKKDKNTRNLIKMKESDTNVPSIYDEGSDEKCIKKVYLPNNKYEDIGFNVMDQNDHEEDLIYDPSAYRLYHEFDLGFPCLSFVIPPSGTNANISNATGATNNSSPLESTFIAGSQLETRKNNQIVMGSVTNICYKNMKEELSSSSDLSNSDEDNYNIISQPNLKVSSFPHNGNVNKIAMTSLFNKNYIATWSDIGIVNIYNITDELNNLINESKPRKNYNNKTPLFSFNGHTDEGYALDWSQMVIGRLASGSCDSTLAVWNPTEDSWKIDCISSKTDYGHQSSVECVQWSPNERDILASCGCDGFIQIWDVRSSATKPIMSIHGHPNVEINVFSWNKYEPLIVSGDDNGIIKVWDFRKLTNNSPSPLENGHQSICEFTHHKKAITSIEWHPTDMSTFISSGEDDQIVIWDLAVDTENLDRGNIPENIDPQIIFVHMGQTEIKECHWHPEHTGLIMSTAFKGFNIFKTISV